MCCVDVVSTLIASELCVVDEEAFCSDTVPDLETAFVPFALVDAIVLVTFEEVMGAQVRLSVAEACISGSRTEAFRTGDVGAGSFDCEAAILSTGADDILGSADTTLVASSVDVTASVVGSELEVAASCGRAGVALTSTSSVASSE